MSVPYVNCKIRYVKSEYPNNYANKEKYENKRKFYSCNQIQDYMTYIATGAMRKLDYISYSGDKDKSTGVFGKNGLLDAKEKRTLRQKLRATKSVIWDCLLTFQPEFGQRYCNDYEQAYEMLKR